MLTYNKNLILYIKESDVLFEEVWLTNQTTKLDQESSSRCAFLAKRATLTVT